MNNKIIILAAVGRISITTDASALPLSPFQSNNSVIEARWAEAYPGKAIRPVAPRFESGSIYMHDGYLYDPTTRRHYDRDRGRWVTDVGSVPTHSVE
jgi:hypothetical protein